MTVNRYTTLHSLQLRKIPVLVFNFVQKNRVSKNIKSLLPNDGTIFPEKLNLNIPLPYPYPIN